MPADNFGDSTTGASFGRAPYLQEFSSYSIKQQRGFIRLVLDGPTRDDLEFLPVSTPFSAFGHKSYQTVYAEQMVALARHESGPVPVLPKSPYTPTLKEVSLDYSAQVVLRPSAPNGVDQYFCNDIFGVAEVGENEAAQVVPTLPGQGALYIGLQGAQIPQLTSFLFQMEEGTVPGPELLEPSDLSWSYLAGNSWKTISSNDIIEEATDTFQQPGLVRVNIGADASLGGTLLPTDLHWLRAAVATRANGSANVENIHTQAGRASLVLPSNEEAIDSYKDHLLNPLAAASITRLSKKLASIKKVSQPYPSVGGRPAENDDKFFQRTSERLRHRNRSSALWDYERIILERFPEVYKVKCLPHLNAENEITPGHTKIVVVPDYQLRPSGNPLRPNFNAAFLRSVEEHLQQNLSSPHINIHVSNPAYESLLVACKVAFVAGFDPGYYSTLLNEEIKRFLSPWAFPDEGQDIVFGGKIHKSEILAFVEGRPYVDFVTDFQLYHRFEGTPSGGIGTMTIGLDFVVAEPLLTSLNLTPTIGNATIGVDFVVGDSVEVAAASSPDAIIVSSETHNIKPLQLDDYQCTGVQNIGIGQMIIDIDFIVVT